MAAYSNSKPIALSYASIFEILWKQGEIFEESKAYNRMQQEFIDIAAHELRTPIQPILSLTEGLHSKVGNTQAEGITRCCYQECKTVAEAYRGHIRCYKDRK